MEVGWPLLAASVLLCAALGLAAEDVAEGLSEPPQAKREAKMERLPSYGFGKRLPSYGYGKRALPGYGFGKRLPTYGYGKRALPGYGFGKRLPSYGYGKRTLPSFGFGKRAMRYGFGKRAMPFGKRLPSYGFGKRSGGEEEEEEEVPAMVVGGLSEGMRRQFLQAYRADQQRRDVQRLRAKANEERMLTSQALKFF